MFAALGAQMLPAYQSYQMHSANKERLIRLHKMKLERKQTLLRRALQRKSLLHLSERDFELDLFQKMRELDAEFARREALRDVLSNKSGHIETIMVLAVLIFGCSFSILRSGVVTEHIQEQKWIGYLFSLSLATSLLSLFVCLWMCLNLQARLSRYNLHNPTCVYDCGVAHESFSKYYSCHCQRLAILTHHLFYVGVFTCLLCNALMVSTTLGYDWHAWLSSVIFCVATLTSIVLVPIGDVILPSTLKQS